MPQPLDASLGKARKDLRCAGLALLVLLLASLACNMPGAAIPNPPTPQPQPSPVIAFTAVPTVAQPTVTEGPPECLIAFLSGDDSAQHLYVMGPDGSNPRQLAPGGLSTAPVWSPDSRKIVFTSGAKPGDPLHLHLVDVATGRMDLQSTDSTSYEMPAFSPDGSRLLVYTSELHTIIAMPGTGGDIVQMTPGNMMAISPSWSPDGSKIAFLLVHTETAGNPVDIYVMNVDGSMLKPLTHGLGEISSHLMAWSPDGTQIAFIAYVASSNTSRLYLLNADGSNLRPLSAQGLYITSFAWSPDGSTVAYTANMHIFLIQPDGGNLRQVTPDNVDAFVPAWSPDGSRIAFGSSGSDPDRTGAGIYVMSIDGSNITPLYTQDKYTSYPVWSPACK